MHVIKLSSQEVRELLEDLQDNPAREVRVAVDGDTFKYKIGQDMWTPPLGTVEP